MSQRGPAPIEDGRWGRRDLDDPRRRDAQPLGVADRRHAARPDRLGREARETQRGRALARGLGGREELLRRNAPGEGHFRLGENRAAARPAIEPVAGLGPRVRAALRGYIPAAILSRLDAGQTDWLSELRPVTVLFINLRA